MKKIIYFVAIGMMALTACNGGKVKQLEEANTLTGDSLKVALAQQDSLLSLLNDITDGMNQIKDMEKILGSTTNLTAESQSRKDQIRNDMMSIQQALQDRRERLEKLESQLKRSGALNATLQKTVENLKAEIANQETTISTLRNELANAKIEIADLGTRVDSLRATVDFVNEEKEKADEATQQAINELNVCYYAIGTKKELKEANIIETGFLRKTKLMQNDFQQSYFTTADKRTLTTINTHAKKAKIITNMPEGSYVIENDGDSKVIRITNTDKFWSLSNYLVIQVD